VIGVCVCGKRRDLEEGTVGGGDRRERGIGEEVVGLKFSRLNK
jgi:hypothetical protein